MNNPFEEIFKRLENIEKMIAPVTGVQPEERQDGKAHFNKGVVYLFSFSQISARSII